MFICFFLFLFLPPFLAQVEKAREQIAELIGAQPKEIIFTSGATESNNIAVKGVAGFYGGTATPETRRRNHVITTQTEHKCVLDSCRWLEQNGFEVTYLPVQSNGLVNIQEFKVGMDSFTTYSSCLVAIASHYVEDKHTPALVDLSSPPYFVLFSHR